MKTTTQAIEQTIARIERKATHTARVSATPNEVIHYKSIVAQLRAHIESKAPALAFTSLVSR